MGWRGHVWTQSAPVNTQSFVAAVRPSFHQRGFDTAIQVFLIQENQQRVNSPQVVFVLCCYFQWKQSVLVESMWDLWQRERAPLVVQGAACLRPHGCLYSLSGQIISIGSAQGCRSHLIRTPAWYTGCSYSLWRLTWLQTSAGCQEVCMLLSTWSSRSTCSVDKMTKTQDQNAASNTLTRQGTLGTSICWCFCAKQHWSKLSDCCCLNVSKMM